MTDKEKIINFLNIKGISKNKFYKTTGFSVGFLDSGSSLGVDKLKIIIDNYHDLNIDYILGNSTDVICPPNSRKNVHQSVHLTPSETELKCITFSEEGIPLIPVEAMAGWGAGDVPVMEYDLQRYKVPEFSELNVDFMIRVKGSSMYPKYNSGDIVACKKLPLDTFFQWNKVYVLDTIQGAMIKRIKQSEVENAIQCVSDNKTYDPFDLDLSEVHALALVVGVIRLE